MSLDINVLIKSDLNIFYKYVIIILSFIDWCFLKKIYKAVKATEIPKKKKKRVYPIEKRKHQNKRWQPNLLWPNNY